ncbi:MAG: radical SAM family heme chaperone HemW [Syntrophales bacterium]|nr:radical SAM family heme chaperone HemW [Syntrophales bacterium]MDD5232478.1 radical SAM family heme chaperone HemW [Syntrophales bacterium]MDD5533316.1 radical SAM family heme chaperone HemW [Syntrophales bacterium]
MSQDNQNRPWGLYIHVPFCASKCRYCAFYSLPSPSSDLVEKFVSALACEMELYRDCGPFDTVYLGGGTPSVLDTEQIYLILNSVRRNFRIEPGAEITVEANPADISPQYAAELLRSGINRLNLGVQSFDSEVLKFLGRRHSPGDALASIKCVRAAGFRNIGLDLIYSIPRQSTDQWLRILEQAVLIRPEHLSCYELTLEPGTPLAEEFRDGQFRTDDETFSVLETTSAALAENGYVHYEVSNFSLPGMESRHNSKYWDHTPYLGLGPSAHSFRGRRRWWNLSSVEEYTAALQSGKSPVEAGEDLKDEQMGEEFLFLGLRTARGVSLSELQHYGLDLVNTKTAILDACINSGLLRIDNDRISPTVKGMAVADALAKAFLA